MQAIETVTVGSGGAASITFSSIPNTYTDLFIVASLRTTGTGSTYSVIQPNNGSASFRNLRGDGSSVVSQSDSIKPYADTTNDSHTANTFGSISYYIPNYDSTTNFKSISIDSVMENNATLGRQLIGAALYASNTAITSIVLYGADANLGFNRNFVQYSTATLYGILAGSDGTTTVT
jgi:hypothetical protein